MSQPHRHAKEFLPGSSTKHGLNSSESCRGRWEVALRPETAGKTPNPVYGKYSYMLVCLHGRTPYDFMWLRRRLVCIHRYVCAFTLARPVLYLGVCAYQASSMMVKLPKTAPQSHLHMWDVRAIPFLMGSEAGLDLLDSQCRRWPHKPTGFQNQAVTCPDIASA